MQVLNALERGILFMAEAARLMGLSVRQVRRLRGDYRRRGPAALVHGNKGRPSPRRVADTIRARLIRLVQRHYRGTNFQHLRELLEEREHLVLSRPTISRILRQAGIPSPRTRRPPRHRQRRERMPQTGMLIQLDGSHHDWLQGRGPRLVLLVAVDDATGEVLAATFRHQEDAHGYLLLLQHLTTHNGVPLAVYTDRHCIFARTRKRLTLEEQLRGRPNPTQVGRVFHELGIRWIPASSPQAKGRIERLFAVFQDRLVTELRLAHIADLASAQAFLPTFVRAYNKRFARPAAQQPSVYRPWPTCLDPQRVFCFKYHRIVANDNTVTVGPEQLQLLSGLGHRSYAKARVEVHHRLDGSLAVLYQGDILPTRLLTPKLESADIRVQQQGLKTEPRRPARRQVTVANGQKAPKSLPWKPAPDHPWRDKTPKEKLRALRAGKRRERLRTYSLID